MVCGMSDHVVLDMRAPGLSKFPEKSGEDDGKVVISVPDEEEPLLQNVECQIGMGLLA